MVRFLRTPLVLSIAVVALLNGGVARAQKATQGFEAVPIQATARIVVTVPAIARVLSTAPERVRNVSGYLEAEQEVTVAGNVKHDVLVRLRAGARSGAMVRDEAGVFKSMDESNTIVIARGIAPGVSAQSLVCRAMQNDVGGDVCRVTVSVVPNLRVAAVVADSDVR